MGRTGTEPYRGQSYLTKVLDAIRCHLDNWDYTEMRAYPLGEAMLNWMTTGEKPDDAALRIFCKNRYLSDCD